MKLRRRTQKLIFSLLVSLLLAGIGYLQQSRPQILPESLQAPPPGTYRVVSFDDGDTITVDMNGKQERVRFIGVDTPETQDPRKPVQCFGKAAAEFTKNLIGTRPVRLESDSLSTSRDRYNRLLKYVYLPDGKLVQAEIIKSGYGFAYTSFPFTKSEEFVKYQREAREQERGLWKSCEPQPNKYGGYTADPE